MILKIKYQVSQLFQLRFRNTYKHIMNMVLFWYRFFFKLFKLTIVNRQDEQMRTLHVS